ncbi:MAG: hypothetical protein F6K65_28360 [Moorea sp. SIO3C2]|nr:hypothetical protein [Moorena sp. SIO3C2]
MKDDKIKREDVLIKHTAYAYPGTDDPKMQAAKYINYKVLIKNDEKSYDTVVSEVLSDRTYENVQLEEKNQKIIELQKNVKSKIVDDLSYRSGVIQEKYKATGTGKVPFIDKQKIDVENPTKTRTPLRQNKN